MASVCPWKFPFDAHISFAFQPVEWKIWAKKKAVQFSLSNFLEQKLQFHFAKILFSFCLFLAQSRKLFDDFVSF